jgi:hypothetical protein
VFADEIPAKVEAVALTGLRAAEWNPRTISDERFQNLCASIQADPDFLRHRPVLALADGTIYAGNMRYRAAEHLGFESVPAILEDIPEQLAKERAMRDNAQWGAWQEDELAALLASLRAEGSDLDLQKRRTASTSGTRTTYPTLPRSSQVPTPGPSLPAPRSRPASTVRRLSRRLQRQARSPDAPGDTATIAGAPMIPGMGGVGPADRCGPQQSAPTRRASGPELVGGTTRAG